jgi:hypothetical protein
VLTGVRTFALGAASRATAAIVFCPITVVKTRMVRQRVMGCHVAAAHSRCVTPQEYAAVSGVVYRNTAHALVTIARQARVLRA